MRGALKAGLFALPFIVAFLIIRLLAEGEAERWRERLEPYAPDAVIGIDEDDLIVVAPDRARARAAAEEVREYRPALAARHADLLGRPRFERMVVVVFPDAASLRSYAGDWMRADRDVSAQVHGYADPRHGAIFVPAEALHTLRHETVHWMMETARGYTAPGYSPWLSEGLAQLFEDFEPGATRNASPGVGPGPRAAVRSLAPSAGLDVDRLIHLEDYEEFAGRDGERNYRDALLLCAFLFEEREEALRRYVDAERQSAQGRPTVFRAIFSHRDETFRRDLRAFLERLRD